MAAGLPSRSRARSATLSRTGSPFLTDPTTSRTSRRRACSFEAKGNVIDDRSMAPSFPAETATSDLSPGWTDDDRSLRKHRDGAMVPVQQVPRAGRLDRMALHARRPCAPGSCHLVGARTHPMLPIGRIPLPDLSGLTQPVGPMDQDDRDDQVLLILQMPSDQALQLCQPVTQGPRACLRIRPARALDGAVGLFHEAVENPVERMVIRVQQVETALDPRVLLPKQREVMVLLDLVMPVQLVDEEPAIPRHALRKPLRIAATVEKRLRLAAHMLHQLPEHHVPLQPETHQPVEVGMRLPAFARMRLKEKAQRLGQAGAVFKRVRCHVR